MPFDLPFEGKIIFTKRDGENKNHARKDKRYKIDRTNRVSQRKTSDTAKGD